MVRAGDWELRARVRGMLLDEHVIEGRRVVGSRAEQPFDLEFEYHGQGSAYEVTLAIDHEVCAVRRIDGRCVCAVSGFEDETEASRPFHFDPTPRAGGSAMNDWGRGLFTLTAREASESASSRPAAATLELFFRDSYFMLEHAPTCCDGRCQPEGYVAGTAEQVRRRASKLHEVRERLKRQKTESSEPIVIDLTGD